MRRAKPRFPTGRAGMPGLTAAAWLAQDTQGASVLSTAKTLLAAERELRRLLPPALGQTCRVARIEATRVTLVVPSGAQAAKLRQMAPRIVRVLNQGGRNLAEVVVRVQAHLPQDDANGARERKVAPLDDTALQAFVELREQTRPGPLADAITRLIEHHRRR
ncbi:MAG: DUF721 domain-containing protein [Candidimonas sp.]|nr:MAG: DUF721 domain-containing protein [Candidimonas sp.]